MDECPEVLCWAESGRCPADSLPGFCRPLLYVPHQWFLWTCAAVQCLRVPYAMTDQRKRKWILQDWVSNSECIELLSFLQDWLFGQVTGSSFLSHCHWPLSQLPGWELPDNSAPVVDGPGQESITRGNLQLVVLRLWTSWMEFCCWANLQTFTSVLQRWRSQTDTQHIHDALTG